MFELGLREISQSERKFNCREGLVRNTTPTMLALLREVQESTEKSKQVAGARVSHLSNVQAHKCQLTPSEHSFRACRCLQDFILSCLRAGTCPS